MDVLANPGATIDADINTGYTITFTLHAQSTGLVYTPQGYERVTYTDSADGVVWLHTDISRVVGQGYCEDGLTREGEKTVTYTNSYDDVGIHYDLPDTQNVNFDTSQSHASYNVRWVDSTNSVGTSRLTVSSEDGSGNPIYGYYAVLSSNRGSVIDTGFTTTAFELDNDALYGLQVQDYGNYVFDHWKESGSTFRDQGIRISSDTIATAVYRDVNSPPLEQQPPDDEEEIPPEEEEPPLPPNEDSSVTIRSIDDNSGNEIAGYYTILSDDNGNAIETGFTPATFDLAAGQAYTVQVQDYGSYYFNYWQDNSDADRARTFTATDSAQTLTAVYSTSPSAAPPEENNNDEEQPPQPTSGTISVTTVDSSGSQIYGYYTILSQNGNVMQTAFSPAEFTVDGDQTYQVEVSDYGSYAFDHWSDGSYDRLHGAEAGDTLVAVYRN